MELTDVLVLGRRYARSIIVVTFLAMLGAFVGLMTENPTYLSRATVFLTVKTSGSAGELTLAMNYASAQAKTYGQLAQTPTILDPAGKALTPQLTGIQLADHLTLSVVEDTASLSIDARAGDAAQAAAMANAVAKEIVRSVTQYSASGTGGMLDAQLVRPAAVSPTPSSPSVPRNAGIALAVGIVLGVSQALLRSRIDTRAVNEDDVARAADVALVGELPYDRALEKQGIVFAQDAFSPRTEAMRRLRTNMEFVSAAGSRSPWIVTSSIPGEGKTSTAIGIAKAFADAGERVLLIDADLRRPQVANALGLESAVGLTTILAGHVALGDVTQHTNGFDVVTSGQIPPNPTELLGSERMARFLAATADAYDRVIVDTPPVLPVTDPAVMARHGCAVLLVASSGTVKRGQLTKSVKALRAVGAHVGGIALNKVRDGRDSYYGYKYSPRYEPQQSPSGGASRVSDRGPKRLKSTAAAR